VAPYGPVLADAIDLRIIRQAIQRRRRQFGREGNMKGTAYIASELKRRPPGARASPIVMIQRRSIPAAMRNND